MKSEHLDLYNDFTYYYKILLVIILCIKNQQTYELINMWFMK